MTPNTDAVARPRLVTAGPAQSELLIHFCGRPSGRAPTPWLDEGIKRLSPSERLSSILESERLLGFPPFGAEQDQPMVCFSESPLDHLKELLLRGWPPWGIVVERQWVYDVGGAPVWYARNDQFQSRTREQKPWVVRLDTDPNRFSDWSHEREWRVPSSDLHLGQGSVVAILAELDWEPRKRTGYFISQATGTYCDADDPFAEELTETPRLWLAAEHWGWDPVTQTVVQR